MALRRHVKNFVKNYSEAEVKVREATSNDPWGPSSSLMIEISDLTYSTISLSEIMNMIWHRMNDHGKNWRHVYKSLTLLDYLIKNGSKKVIQHCQEGFFNIQVLKDFHHLDEAGKDQGFHVREKAKQVLAILKDEQLMHNEREIARRTRRRISHAMLFSQKPSNKAYVPATLGSDPISELPPSENVQHLLSRALPAAEQNQQTGKAEIAQEATALNIIAKKSSEDLITFSEDESCPVAVESTFPATVCKEELAKGTKAPANNSWNTDSASSIGTTSSFSTFSISSPESAVPNNTPQPYSVALHGPSYMPSSHGLPSVFFKDLKERIVHSFSPCPVSDVDDNTSNLSLLPDNSKCSVEKNDSFRSRTYHASGERWVNNLVEEELAGSNPVSPATNLPPATDLFPLSAEEKNMSILEEIKNAVCGLRGDFCSVAQELRTIGSELANMVVSVQNMNQFFAAPQTAKNYPTKI